MPLQHHEHVDCIEVNHVYDKEGRLMFSQVVLWKIDQLDGKLHNHGWKMIKTHLDYPCRIPAKDMTAVYHENERGSLVVISPCFRVCRTHEDMERMDTRNWWGGNAPNLFLMEVEVK